MAETKTAIAVLSQYFGRKPGQSLAEFAAEIKALSAEDKRFLAEGAAAELGVTLKV